MTLGTDIETFLTNLSNNLSNPSDDEILNALEYFKSLTRAPKNRLQVMLRDSYGNSVKNADYPIFIQIFSPVSGCDWTCEGKDIIFSLKASFDDLYRLYSIGKDNERGSTKSSKLVTATGRLFQDIFGNSPLRFRVTNIDDVLKHFSVLIRRVKDLHNPSIANRSALDTFEGNTLLDQWLSM